ncbi:MAG: 7,8-dihydropterin-6-yl-methyl-4-(beta-D-ribofuranosyl)aminobenzene 5'-phosphate synthase [Desulforhopalus sp.]|jgi:7,8-dihydropterin-6-yl-methyl-4-(beta-D-ribofuranosyl)aminobenzene 5'-phosphate synthase
MNAKNIRIQIIVDNEAKNGLHAEHGYALWLEIDDQKILFDTGQKDALLYNAKQLRVHLEKADTLVLSHGHYDHTGGLADVLSCNHSVHVYCHAAAFLPRYSIRDGIAKPVKMTTRAMSSIDALSEERMHWVTKAVNIGDAVAITGAIPRETDFETTDGSFYFDQDGKRADAIADDMALWVESSQGLVICIGCCHAGIINTINHIKKVSGVSKIHALIGGLHLMGVNDQRLQKTIDLLKKENIEKIITCHCTGDIAHHELGEQLHAIRGFAGMDIQITE